MEEQGKSIIQIGNLFKRKRINPNDGRVYSVIGISPTINCGGGGNLQPFIIEIWNHSNLLKYE